MITELERETNPELDRFKQYEQYFNNPVGFCREVLKLEHVTPKQQELLEGLIQPPYCILAPSGNSAGKTTTLAAAAIWWHCTRVPSLVITTAGTALQVKIVLWREIRKLASAANLSLGFMPKNPEIWRGSNDFVIGMTAIHEASLKGQHETHMLFLLDEASAVDGIIWNAIETQVTLPTHALLAAFNCDDPASRVHDEMMRAERKSRGANLQYRVIRQNSLEHPNIDAELRGELPLIPEAIRVAFVEKMLKKYCQLVGCTLDDPHGLHIATDIVWPPVWAEEYCERTQQKPRWWRPGAMFEIIILGRYPSQGSSATWSEGDWMAATREGYEQLPIPFEPAQLGVDVARFGDDDSSIHVRIGPCSVHHEDHHGQSEPETMRRIIALCKFYAQHYNEELGKRSPAEQLGYRVITEFELEIKVDDDGLGGTLSSFLIDAGYRAIRVGAGTLPNLKKDYRRRRDELWFTTAELARDNQLDLSRIRDLQDGEEILEDMRRQAMSCTYTIDGAGRRIVLEKDEMKKLMGGSPDKMDAVNLCWCVPTEENNDALGEILTSRQSPLAGRHDMSKSRNHFTGRERK